MSHKFFDGVIIINGEANVQNLEYQKKEETHKKSDNLVIKKSARKVSTTKRFSNLF